MVKLEDKLMEILDLRKENFSGEDIKNVVESIMIAKSLEPVKLDPDKLPSEEVMKEWMGE